ncbi:hypothetical protein GCM10011506_44440 [Marivirga lumbricoides]|uniref:Phage tail collar domain-containing protein n=2 Tax=Marivirga lumbricoides TaxID=1046115 RepID=A0ABQ1N4L8_9BACT|nr:hypothetical protein GCM10011506_44440 [Marivirga lumbricoides]
MQVFAQVGINNVSPDESAVLDLKATDKGLLIPRMTTDQRNNIIDPAASLLVYDTDYEMFFFFKNGRWFIVNPWVAEVADDTNPTIDNYVRLSGNVGIGVAAPSEKLEVNGSIKNSGDINSSGDLTTGSITASGDTEITGDATVGGDIAATGTITGSKVYGEGTVPVGTIVMWSGATPPAGWALCQGQSAGIPDLRGRFIVGYDTRNVDYNTIGKTGGAAAVELTEAQMPAHRHKYTDLYRNDGNAGGSRSERGGTSTSRSADTDAAGGVYIPGSPEERDMSGKPCMPGQTTGCNPNHGSIIKPAVPPRYETRAHENRPPYYTLAYIIKLAY